MTDTNPRNLHPMTNQIPIEEALKLVQFKQGPNGSWYVENVCGSVGGNVEGDVCGNVGGSVGGNVEGNVCGNVYGNVEGSVCGEVGGTVRTTINGRKWQFIETPKEKLKRLIQEGADKAQLLEAFNQLEESND